MYLLYKGPGQRAEIRIRYYEDQEMMIRPWLLALGASVAPTNFVRDYFGGFWDRPMLFEAGGERDTGRVYHSFIPSTAGEKM